jgi:hypothetical protein
MNGKHRRHESAAPERTRHLQEQGKEQEHRNRVQQHVGEVMPASL